MKTIRIYLLSITDPQLGAEISWHYSEKDRMESLIRVIIDDDDDLAEALACLADPDDDGERISELLKDYSEQSRQTWQTETADRAEVLP